MYRLIMLLFVCFKVMHLELKLLKRSRDPTYMKYLGRPQNPPPIFTKHNEFGQFIGSEHSTLSHFFIKQL